MHCVMISRLVQYNDITPYQGKAISGTPSTQKPHIPAQPNKVAWRKGSTPAVFGQSKKHCNHSTRNAFSGAFFLAEHWGGGGTPSLLATLFRWAGMCDFWCPSNGLMYILASTPTNVKCRPHLLQKDHTTKD